MRWGRPYLGQLKVIHYYRIGLARGGGYQIYGLARQIYQSLVHILVGARFERFEAYEPPSCLGVVNCNTHLNLNNGYMTKL